MDSSSVHEKSMPLPRVASFIRQLTHDVRNGLNGIDLQAALISELTSEPELRDEAKRLRNMTAEITRSLQKLSSAFADVSLTQITFPADEFLQEFRARLSKEFPAESVNWRIETGGVEISVDVEAMITALMAIFRNAFQFRQDEGELRFLATVSQSHIIFELAEKKSTVPSDPARWGLEPLSSTRRGGYGLGLFHARKIVAAHGGEFASRFDNGTLTTTIKLPLAEK
jgi:signal transduction histidine kinase